MLTTAAPVQDAAAGSQADEARCPICDGSGHEIASLPECGRRALACADCGFTFIWPRIEQDFSETPESAYYGDWQLLDLDATDFLVNDIAGAVGRRVTQRLGGSDAPAILDAGCGAGHVLLDFRARGWRVEGVDPWAAVTAIGRKYYRLPMTTARIEEAAIEPSSKDAVLALDVLQFVAEPKAFLRRCAAALTRGGLLCLTVPNFGSAESRRDPFGNPLFVPTSYLSYFTEDDLHRLLEGLGFYRVRCVAYGGPDDDQYLRVHARAGTGRQLRWEDLAEEIDDSDLPPLDRADVDEARLSPEQRAWRRDGYLIVPRLIPPALIDRYCRVRENVGHADGWPSSTPYLDVPEVRDLCLYKPLTDLLAHLIGEPMALHLNLTGWVSTERDWHQDDYLNPSFVNGHYAAVWTALDRIRPQAGPFEFVPGSHRWPIIRQARVLDLIGYEAHDNSWPWASERLLTPFFESEIRRRNAKIESFLADKGDVLIWHARLLHRGSLPREPGAERRSMIAHYSALTRRPDMPWTREHSGGGQYFVFEPPEPEPAPPEPEPVPEVPEKRRWIDRLKTRR